MGDVPRILVLVASSVLRQGAAEVLRAAGAEVKTAANASIALNRIVGFHPALILVDLEEPDAEGFLAALAQRTTALLVGIVTPARPPSSVLMTRCWATLERPGHAGDSEALAQALRGLLKRFQLSRGSGPRPAVPRVGGSVNGPSPRRGARQRPRVICIGASTGGPAAIEKILSGIGSAELPGIVIAQHMTDGYIAPLATRLARATGLDVVPGVAGMPVRARSVILAPGNRHIEIVASPTGYAVDIVDSPPIHRFKPSIDVLFHSAARVAADDGIGVILTGMQKDGAEGLKAMHDRGAYTIAQNEETCTVFSMPRAAIALDGVDEIAPLDEICGLLLATTKS